MKFNELALWLSITSVVVLGTTVLIQDREHKNIVFNYQEQNYQLQKEIRIQHEYLKACEAVMSYEKNLLDKHGIDSVVR